MCFCITCSGLGQIIWEAQQRIEYHGGERELREVEVDFSGVMDKFEEVIGNEFNLYEDLFPPGSEVPDVADVSDEFVINPRGRPCEARRHPMRSDDSIVSVGTLDGDRRAVGLAGGRSVALSLRLPENCQTVSGRLCTRISFSTPC